ncbi:MAG: hypothetical protein EG825_10285 [Rhodocyclaceae bacterium]|nr:hypothetical protein [Rhodocyclaceae bacterium]
MTFYVKPEIIIKDGEARQVTLCQQQQGSDSSSSSSSSVATTTTNTDKRLALQSGIGISSDQSTVNVQAMDAGIVNKALDTVASADATGAASFDKVLTLAEKLFSTGSAVLGKTADSTLGAVAALNTAQNDAAGKVDQKTIILLGAAAVAGVVAWRHK